MHVGYRVPREWTQLNEQLSEALGLEQSKCAVQAFQGVGHALIEVCMGLARLFPLKKKITYFKSMNPYFEAALMPLAKEGYKIAALDLEALNSPTEWAQSLGREDLFVLYSLDEPILGRSYDVEALDKVLSEKGIFKICVSHSQHFYEGGVEAKPNFLDRNRATIYSVSRDQAIAVLGERGRLLPLIAEQLFYSSDWDTKWFQSPKTLVSENVLALEEKGVADSQPVFPPQDRRVADRAVIYWPDLDGHAVIDRLAKKLKIELKPPGQETRLETTSLSRWGGVRTMDFLKAQGLLPEAIRGLVSLSTDVIEEYGLVEIEKLLVEIRQSILEDQFGRS